MKLRSKIFGINLLVLAVVLGVVFVATIPVLLKQHAEDLAFFVIVLVVAGFGSMFLRTVLVELTVLRRISNLTDRVNHIKDYRSYYEELHDSGKDEVAVLANAINLMLQRIVSSTNEVGELNAELEVEKTGIGKLTVQAEKLDAERARLKASVDNLTLGFIMVDAKYDIVFMNDRAKKILAIPDPDSETKVAATSAQHNWTIDEIDDRLGQHLGLRDQLAKSLRGGEPVDYTDIEYHDHILRVLISPILESQQPGDLGCVIVLEDITEQKLMERSRDEFFSIASHELRTPLTAIRGNTSLIKQFYQPKVNDGAFDEMVDDIHSSSVRLIQIVNDFLDVSRLEQGKIKMKLENFDMTEVLENVVYEMIAIAKDKKDQIIIDKTLKTMPKVYADKDRVKQVIYNLVGNALKFTENGSITISAQKEGSMLKVFVTDTGPGIAPDQQARLFNKFQQAGSEAYTRETSRGTGLGLYISKLLVGRMGGAIALERSELGKGTTLSFTLPLQAA